MIGEQDVGHDFGRLHALRVQLLRQLLQLTHLLPHPLLAKGFDDGIKLCIKVLVHHLISMIEIQEDLPGSGSQSQIRRRIECRGTRVVPEGDDVHRGPAHHVLQQDQRLVHPLLHQDEMKHGIDGIDEIIDDFGRVKELLIESQVKGHLVASKSAVHPEIWINPLTTPLRVAADK